MSLNEAEMAATGAELRRHLAASGLSAADVARWLGLDVRTVESVLAMDGRVDPVTVWLVRDALDAACLQAGADGGGWSVLTEASRARARQWFDLASVPPRPDPA